MTPNGEGRTNPPSWGDMAWRFLPLQPRPYRARRTLHPIKQETLWSDDNLRLERQHTCLVAVPGGQAATVAGPSEPLQLEPLAKERIFMLYYATTQA
jgi:hypothetical protein